MKLLLLIILFIIFFPIIKMWMMMRRARRNMEDVFEQVRRRNDETVNERSYGQRYQESIGEYADYEDVAGSRPESETVSYDNPSTGNEEQVVDAEFEDIR